MHEKILSLVLAIGVASCGGAPATQTRSAPPIARSAPEAPAPARDDDLPSLDRVAASGAALAPGMKELARLETTAGTVREILAAATHDTCVRVAFVANAPVAPELDDERGQPIATSKRGTSGAIGEQGPVCVRKNSSVRALFAGDATARVRFVVWASP